MTRPQSPIQITALGIIALPHSQEPHARQHHEPARALEKSIEPGRTHPIPPAFSQTRVSASATLRRNSYFVGFLISKPIEFICAPTASGSSAHDDEASSPDPTPQE